MHYLRSLLAVFFTWTTLFGQTCQHDSTLDDFQPILDSAYNIDSSSPIPMHKTRAKELADRGAFLDGRRAIDLSASRQIGLWTGLPISVELTRKLAKRGSEREMIRALESDFNFKIIVASGNQLRLNRASKPSGKPEYGDFLGTINNGVQPPNPLMAELIESVRTNSDLKYYQEKFESQALSPYLGMFLAPGRNMPFQSDKDTRPFKDRPIMLLKDSADRETILHEFIHYQLWFERHQRGEADPWAMEPPKPQTLSPYGIEKAESIARRKLSEFKIAIARIGEELDVHQFISDNGKAFGLSESQIASSSQGYWDHLQGSNYSEGVKTWIEKTEDYMNRLSGSPEILKIRNETALAVKEAKERYQKAISNGPLRP